MDQENKLEKLQAEGYRLIRIIEQAQMRLRQVNQEIEKYERGDIYNDKAEEEKIDNERLYSRIS